MVRPALLFLVLQLMVRPACAHPCGTAHQPPTAAQQPDETEAFANGYGIKGGAKRIMIEK